MGLWQKKLNVSLNLSSSLSLIWCWDCLKSWWHVFEVIVISTLLYFLLSLFVSVGKAKRCLHRLSTSSAAPCLSAPSTCQEPSCRQRPSSERTLHSHLMCLRSFCPTFCVTAHFVPRLLLSPVPPRKAVRLQTFSYSKNEGVVSAYVTVRSCVRGQQLQLCLHSLGHFYYFEFGYWQWKKLIHLGKPGPYTQSENVSKVYIISLNSVPFKVFKMC